MASAATISSSQPRNAYTPSISCIKDFAESNGVVSIPSAYCSLADRHDEIDDDLSASIPVIDFSLLTSPDPQTHANALSQLVKACVEWGFFMLVNHGIPESLTQEVMKKSSEFHNLPLEYKKKFSDEGVFTPIRYGTSSHTQEEKAHYWRDYLKTTSHPEFSFPEQPPGFKEAAFEYTRKIRDIVENMLQEIAVSLGLERDAILKCSDFDSGFQKFQVNLYPPCPRPDLALGLPPHTDNGFFTLLTQNGICGLQVRFDGKWVNVNPVPNCLLVVNGDQLEAVSNGRYKSVWHRAVLNARKTRVTLTVANGPALDNELGPAPELLKKEEPLFKSIKYRDYVHLQQEARCAEKRALDDLRINFSN